MPYKKLGFDFIIFWTQIFKALKHFTLLILGVNLCECGNKLWIEPYWTDSIRLIKQVRFVSLTPLSVFCILKNLRNQDNQNLLLIPKLVIAIIISRKPQYKDVYRRTIEMPQRARTFQVNCCLKIHNAHQKLLLLSPIQLARCGIPIVFVHISLYCGFRDTYSVCGFRN